MKTVLAGIGTVVLIAGGWFVFSQGSAPEPQSEEIGTPEPAPPQQPFSLTSPDFPAGGSIPSEFTCDGAEAVPRLSVAGVPSKAKSLVLIMDDPDIPDFYKRQNGVDAFDHWILFSIPPDTKEISESTEGIAGMNGFKQNGYRGPCPPREYEPRNHAYSFRVYALDALLPLEGGATKQEVEKAMEGYVIAETELIGRYQRP